MDTEKLISQFRKTQNIEIAAELFRYYFDALFLFCNSKIRDKEKTVKICEEMFPFFCKELSKSEKNLNFRQWFFQMAKKYLEIFALCE